MTPKTNTEFHLTEDQIDDCLIGDLAPEAAAHLEACSPCLTRVARAEEPLASFRAVSLAWSERRSATLPLQASASARPNWARRLAWGAAAAAAIAIGVAIPAVHHTSETSGQDVSVAASAAAVQVAAPASREEQIARDNQMLKAIDRELDASVESPASFGLPVDSHARSRTRTSLQD
jgi:hypothetical protein